VERPRLVTIFGGAGVFGRRVAIELAKRPDVRLRLVGRSESAAVAARALNAEHATADVSDPRAVAAAIAGSFLVIHAAGPFRAGDYAAARPCITAGAHYFDFADGREFVVGIGALDAAARAAGVLVVSGVSTVPALTAAMVAELAGEFAAVEAIDAALSPGGRNPRGAATIASVLAYLGRPVRATVNGRAVARIGWGDARTFEFPPPMGVRRVHSCDAPDTELFPRLFGAKTVRFAAGLELNAINAALSLLAGIRRVVPLPGLERFAPAFAALSRPIAALGTTAGGVGMHVTGTGRDGRRIVRRAAVFTESDSAAIAAGPAIVAAERLLEGGGFEPGARPGAGACTWTELRRRLEPFGVRFARGEGGGWADSPR
jgi:saccharopine dehydrogenase-like NADP-dependent oxidoreductase